MEQKRTLWILAAVGVFLLVVLGAALIFYSSSAKENQTVAVMQDESKPSNGWISLSSPAQQPPLIESVQLSQTENSPENHSLDLTEQNAENSNLDDGEKTQVTKVSDMTVIADSATVYNLNTSSGGKETDEVTTIDLRTLTPEQATAVAKSETTVQDKENKSPANVEKSVAATAFSPANTQKRTEEVKPIAKTPQKPAAKPAQTQSPAVAVKPAPKQSQKTAAETAKKQYWVQVTSLTSRKSADEARAVLDENKIAADVFTYEDGKNQLFYRVRVGPYMTKVEAEYWQAQIAKIEKFSTAASYVTSTN
ncbi:MAG: SPOR domain-containing protein [Treponema sp.]